MTAATATQTTKVAEHIVFANRFATVRNDAVLFGDTPGTHVVVTSGALPGVVVIIKCADTFLLVNQYRYPIGAESIEFVRGGRNAGESSVEAAAREVGEETGIALPMHRFVELGQIQPDTGLLDTEATAWFVEVDEDGEGFYASIPLGTLNYSKRELLAAIASGQIKCGFTLAALMLAIAGGFV